MDHDPATTAKAELRVLLRAAMVRRDRTEVALLRSAISALDQAEVVPGGGRDVALGGSADVPRRRLAAEEVSTVLEREVDELRASAARYRELDDAATADRLEYEATLLHGITERFAEPARGSGPSGTRPAGRPGMLG